MVTSAASADGTAKRVRKNTQWAPGKVVMASVVCDQCGAQFAIVHSAALRDQALAQRQATWLADQFVWDHIQENHHRSSIQLPRSDEMK